MSNRSKQQMKLFSELSDMLTQDIVQRLQDAINIPAGIKQSTGTNPTMFLNSLKNWKQFDPHTFDLALQSIGDNAILYKARQIKWLTVQMKTLDRAKPVQPVSLIELLTSEMKQANWVVLTSQIENVNVKGDEDPMQMLQICVENDIITEDIEDLANSLELIKRNDLANKVRAFKPKFQNVSSDNFRKEIYRELGKEEVESGKEWVFLLKKFLEKQNKDVSVVLDEASVPIESVYTPLTVIKIEPVKERMQEESGIDEIQFLRNINQQLKLQSIEMVDFESIITSSDSSEIKIISLIGNPGSGKTFLSKHLAFLYGTNQLTNFRYLVSITCRNPAWHKMEEVRNENDSEVDETFILNWLSLSMSLGARWSKSLSQHLLRSDGEGLLIILDGADEFTRAVPFQSTLLCQILERRFLSRSSILITSRPSAWTELLLTPNTNITIDGNFQVLGFSPENRDLYFEKRIEGVDKLNAVHELFYLHDEIKQLSLVPVNASLFSALFNQSDNILANTLSHLYLQLIVYMIRRQLARINLIEQSKIVEISNFHPAIKESIQAIGLEANQGIFERELTSDKNIPLKIRDKEYDSERLGLMQAHTKVVSFGKRIKVWTFQHLTIQEFMTALSICDNSWRNQCFIIRYFTSSTQYFAMYRMVIRFVCGILKHNAGCITPILCRHVLPVPMPLHDASMSHQLCYFTELVEISDWILFTESFLMLCSIMIETNSINIPEQFSYFKHSIKFPLYLYFLSTISPNEFLCFIKSLKYIPDYQIILFQSDYVTHKQFQTFLENASTSNILYIALAFFKKDYDSIHPYTSSLTSESLQTNTRVSIEFQDCDLSACDSSLRLFSSTNQFTGSLSLYDTEMNNQLLCELTNQFSSLLNFYYRPNSSKNDWPILHQSISSNQLNGLYISDLNDLLPVTPDILSTQSALKELFWHRNKDCYSLVPYLNQENSLAQLILKSPTPPSHDSVLYPLANLILSNSNTLREIGLSRLQKIGFSSWNNFFTVLTPCSNLIMLQLYLTEFKSDDMDGWDRALSALNSVTYLLLSYIPLEDSGLLVLCYSLACHPAIRRLAVQKCEISSESCVSLSYLIRTLPRIRILEFNEKELSSPNPEQLHLLKQTAEECSVEIDLY